MKKSILVLATIMLSNFAGFSQTAEIKSDVTLIKANLNASKVSIKKYAWIETITTFVNGEQKSVTQNQCYYDVTGTLTKVPTGATTQPAQQRGLRGAIADSKREAMDAYITNAITKIKTYIPPVAEKLDAIYNKGGVGIQIVVPDQKFKLSFPNYNQPGDMINIGVDKTNKLLTGYDVSTTVTDPTDVVTLDITVLSLPDGTQYPGNITFNSASQNLKITVTNSGFKLGAGQ